MIESITKNQQASGIIASMEEFEHEQILFCQDRATGLKAIIAVHNTVLGPSLGGTRMWNYQTEQDALKDVLRLSRGMTYKSSLAGLNLGGGKAVIIGDSRKIKSEGLFRRFGQFVNSLGGKYITAEDVGITTKDIEWVSQETKYVAGKPDYLGGGGDPSPVTAYGVYMGMKAAAKKQFGNDSLENKTVLVQGVGHVGAALVDYLVKENATVVISDIFEDSIKKVTQKHPQVSYVASDEIFDVQMDIYAPCALGATINDESLKKLKCSIISGAANNQLEDEKKHGIEVMKKGILYAPDYLVNAGGIINCYWEIIGYNREAALAQTEDIYNTALNVFEQSQKENTPTYLVANKMAEKRIETIGNINKLR